jgi:hypothetical protein
MMDEETYIIPFICMMAAFAVIAFIVLTKGV